MIDVGPTSDGRRTFHISAATIAAVASSLGIFVYAGGFITGYMMMRQNLTELQTRVVDMQAKLDGVSDRLTHVEADAHFTAQGVADLKALTAGTKR